MNTGKFIWAFGAILLIMLAIVLIKPEWVRGQAEPEPVQTIMPLADTDQARRPPANWEPCIYYWKVEGLAQLTRQLPEQEAGPYPVKPQPVYVAFYPVSETVFTEGLSSRDEILKRLTLPPSFVLGQWDPTYPPKITFTRRECPADEN